MRISRVKNDENVPPHGTLAKAFHQRNKSSPALTSFPGGHSLKTAAKRNVFADVSNTASVIRDDSILHTKPALQPTVKHAPTLNERRSVALLKPAQRPFSLTGLKPVTAAGNGHAASDYVPKAELGENNATQQQNQRKALSKRPTMIFKDNPTAAVPDNTLNTLIPVTSCIPSINAQVENLAGPNLDDLPILPPPSSITQRPAEPTKAVHEARSDTSLPEIHGVSLEPAPLYSETHEACIHEVAPVMEPSKPQVILPQVVDSEPPKTHAPLHDISAVAPKAAETKQVSVASLINPVNHIPALNPHHTEYEQAMEPEEYWDDDDDENYEEEGYVTARSFRSKGDNTTGGTTLVLFPQVNNRVRKEISAAKQLVEATRSPEEIEDESYDTSMVAEYGDEIFDYMRHLEVKMLPNAHYMDNQHEIQWSMRSVLMDWLVQVHHRFNLLPETLFLCVNYIDRFLSCKVVSLAKLQLVGATAIFIAAKYEEINCPSVQEIVYMVDGGYTIDEILKAERFMLTMLQFELGWPGPMSFLRRISKADDYDLETRTLAKYFLEVTLMDERFIGSPPSFTAAASHCLSRMMLRKGTWSPHHVYYSGYTFSQLKALLNLLLECCEDPRKHHAAVYNKYCDKRYKRASAFVETEMQRGFQLPDPVAIAALSQPPTIEYYDSVSFFRV
ncbi:uncharacterized protein A1O9_08185 [Exophiala aquamarina CBS 119918]|uniref:Uncharacterized protein n=1 Tax=Exophiala aquamarina CBS 119918 TaxID=1182545 RepID=A0A072PIT4_9EURO|nr:uncharacterized protein A1O9_08185 [Exophiala aquamarina CBS 119918]KEF55435.1 hypothetical protein A1O9_08185 [Exophiala aquamarina CBS 119918]